ncbi:ubiquinol-cytochrome C chaperone family protein [Sphingomonas cavernae]|uniref:Ubiquinol-cytochrome C chaperone n=1 Tax=Sphingomonas cavernae TaxID=2320861 RepID=A0A418WQR9_9SPHN|nr:ubiquinol-cytochrome C chaperone family protein [Sphingomonas cavernae]RJF93598.1 ubiquinol-cytochrome C chaperone [Sphingomonas cavernae]
MSILSRLFARQSGRDALVPLYSSIVEAARDPAWYLDGGVADTVDGRFDMVAALLSMALVRLEREGKSGADQSVLLTEIFIEDMDGQLRQIGIGDIIVGKHIGKMMSALGGRLSAYRGAIAASESWEDALTRNLYRGSAPDAEALSFSAARMRTLAAALDATDAATLVTDGFPRP